MLDWVFGNRGKRARGKRGSARAPAYEKARAIAQKGDVRERSGLAGNEYAQPEILYFFATDEATEVRREVARNPGTPLQADLILARDIDDEVRCDLALKIGRLVPTLTPDESERLSEMAMEVLDILAADHLPRVRAIIAEELKRADNVPRNLIRRLAEDLEEIVSVPVLEYSPLLRSEDLVEIIARGVRGRNLVAISKRRELEEPVSDAVAATGDRAAVQTLLENRTAKLADDALDRIIEKAEENKSWHNAMVYRDDLPVRTVMRIASFVSAALMEVLMVRHQDNAAVVEDLRMTVRARIERGELDSEEEPHETAEERAKRMFDAGQLDEALVKSAVAEFDNAFVRHALALMAEIPVKTANTMLNSGSGKAVTALAWKAQLSMAAAVLIQEKIARLRPNAVIQANEDGSYPMPEQDLVWYMESFFV
jgi:uncharacterized protein (DUF2336 family)